MNGETIRNSYELFLPEERETMLYAKIEMPHFAGEDRTTVRINRFYEKKSDRIQSYLKGFADKAYRKRIRAEKRGGSVSVPSSVKMSFRVTRCDDSVISILFVSETVTESRVDAYYSAECWDRRDGHLILLSDLYCTLGKHKSALFDAICDALPQKARYLPHLKRNIRRFYATDNFYYDGDDIVVFYQPGTLRDKAEGITEIRLP